MRQPILTEHQGRRRSSRSFRNLKSALAFRRSDPSSNIISYLRPQITCDPNSQNTPWVARALHVCSTPAPPFGVKVRYMQNSSSLNLLLDSLYQPFIQRPGLAVSTFLSLPSQSSQSHQQNYRLSNLWVAWSNLPSSELVRLLTLAARSLPLNLTSPRRSLRGRRRTTRLTPKSSQTIGVQGFC
jgi:hypothetical protein